MFILIISTLVLSCSCIDEDNNEEMNQTTNTNITQNLKLDDITEKDKFHFQDPIYFFTLSDIGEVYATAKNIPLGKYDKNGKLINEYKDADNLCNIHYYNNKIYAYDEGLRKIVEYDLINENKKDVSDVFEFDMLEIKNLFIINNKVFILFIPAIVLDEDDDEYEIHHPFTDPDENDYISFNEKLYSIDLNTGKLTDEAVNNIMLMYKSMDEKLYFYCYENKNYILYSVDSNTMKKTKIAEMNDVKYILSFIFENNNFAYINNYMCLYNKCMSDEKITVIDNHIISGSGSNVQFYNGHVVYRIMPSYVEIEKASISSIYIGYIYDKKDENSNSEKKKTSVITISGDPNGPLQIKYLKEETGFATNFSNMLLVDEFLTKFMAGDSSVDIYSLYGNSFVTKRLKEMGYYVPLNNSRIISNYVSGCFDYISDNLKNNEDIFAFPINATSTALLYIPENLKQFNIDGDDFKTYDNYINLLRELVIKKDNGELGEYLYSNGFVSNVYGLFEIYYEAEFCDFENRIFNYNTDMFKNLFETMWNGWDMTQNEHGNPLIINHYLDFVVNDDHTVYHPENDVERMLFKMEYIPYFLKSSTYSGVDNTEYDKWRAYPYPKMTENFNKNYIGIEYAIINPYSNNKEEAVEYLEAIAKNPYLALDDAIFLQKDINTYNEFIDITLPVFNDIFEIHKNGFIKTGYIPEYQDDFIANYQQGRLTLDEAVALKQRQVEMALNE